VVLYNVLFWCIVLQYPCVSIVGGRGTGKTVFVGLLGNTAINYSVEVKQRFRYFASPEAVTKIQEIVQSLKLRQWPQATLKGSLSEYKFSFAYSKSLIGILKGKFMGSFKRLESPEREFYNIIDFSVYDISGEDAEVVFRAASLARDRGSSVLEMIPGTLETALDCNVIVFLVDSSKTTIDNSRPEYKEMLEYDGLMASLMSLVALYRSKKYGVEAGKLFPVFVFTKFDLVDKEVLKVLGIPENFDRWLWDNSRYRTEIEERLTKLMKRFYQHTLAIIYGGVIMNVPLEKARMFVSYLMTELSEEGTPVPRVVKASDNASYDIAYSRSEYVRFIEHFGMIADKIKKARKVPEEVASVTGVGR